eukprot:13228-Rhodomonas_salina.1
MCIRDRLHSTPGHSTCVSGGQPQQGRLRGKGNGEGGEKEEEEEEEGERERGRSGRGGRVRECGGRQGGLQPEHEGGHHQVP